MGCKHKAFFGFLAGCNSRFQSSSYVLRCTWLLVSAAVQGFWQFNYLSLWLLTTQSRGPPYEHCIQIFIRRVGPLFWLLGPWKQKVSNGLHSFLALGVLCAFVLCLPSKLDFALSSNPSFRQSLVADLSFRRDLLPLLVLASKSDLRFYYGCKGF